MSFAPRSLARPGLLLAGLLLALPALAAPDHAVDKAAAKAEKTDLRDAARIAVVVNDAAITNADIAARYGMALLSSGLPDSPEARSRIMPQVVRGLIEEQLQLQEMRRQQIEVSDAEINNALARIAKDNNVPGGDMRAFFKAHGIAPRTLETQAKASIGWSKLVQRQLRPRVEVSDGEVDEIVARMQANAGKTEYFVNEIFLPIDDPEQEAAVRGFADKLLKQIQQTGAFGAIARQFSQGAGAQNGGEIGWVQQGTLAPEIDAALAKGKVGDLIGPLKSSKGYHIVAIRDARTITVGGDAGTRVKLAQVGLAVMPPRTLKQTMAEVDAARKSVKGCADLESRFPRSKGWGVQIMPERSIAEIPPALAPQARNLPVGSAGEPEPQGNGVAFMIVCERVESGGGIDRSAIMSNIGGERLENLARGLLRDLKRNAYIDMRI